MQEPLAHLTEEYRDAIYSFLLGMSGDHELSEDLTQDVLLNAAEALEAFRGDSHLKTWLYRIARNAFLNRCADVRAAEISLDDLVERGYDFPCGEEEETCPEELACREDKAEKIRTVLGMLSEEDQSLLAYLADGMSGAEIATELGISVSAAWARASRARERLREGLVLVGIQIER